MELDLFMIGIGLFGVLMIIMGLYNLFGSINSLYIAGYAHLTLALYTFIPSGLFFVSMFLGSYFPAPTSLYILNSGGAIAIIGTYIMSRPLMQPKWVKWLKREHGDILDVIQIEIRKEPYWNRMINTQEELEAWVEEIRATKNLWS